MTRPRTVLERNKLSLMVPLVPTCRPVRDTGQWNAKASPDIRRCEQHVRPARFQIWVVIFPSQRHVPQGCARQII
eukprot:5903072-Pyramimonas_sp.AAC.1